jgi:UDP-N-acetyl-D-mannosaminuronate dehydrogenase
VSEEIVIVMGLGEVGRPLLNILSRTYECIGIDVEPVPVFQPCSVLHVCYPSQIPRFVETTVSYVEKYSPDLVIINSTVEPGTTRRIQEFVGCPVVFSPVRGKHVKMEQDLLRYVKFVAGTTSSAAEKAAQHFVGAGFRTATFPNPEIGEVSKLVETTWLGLLIGWAQEVERLAAQYGGSYEDINAFIKEIDFLPSHIYPGHIGGHCVMPNIALLQRIAVSKFLDAVVESNFAKEQETLVSLK